MKRRWFDSSLPSMNIMNVTVGEIIDAARTVDRIFREAERKEYTKACDGKRVVDVVFIKGDWYTGPCVFQIVDAETREPLTEQENGPVGLYPLSNIVWPKDWILKDAAEDRAGEASWEAVSNSDHESAILLREVELAMPGFEWTVLCDKVC